MRQEGSAVVPVRFSSLADHVRSDDAAQGAMTAPSEEAGPGAPAGSTRRFRRDDVALPVLAVFFASGLGIASVALPLRALDAGYGAGTIGVLVALSALVQIAARSQLGAVMRRVPDRLLLGFAPVAMTVAFVLLIFSSSLPVLAAGWIFVALGRALFWTVGQTHVVRRADRPMHALARMNFFGNLGSLVGPAAAGLMAESGIRNTLVAGAVVAAVAVLPVFALDTLPLFERSQKKGDKAMWRRPGVDAGCWAGATAGAWRGLMEGYVPVVLQAARQSSTTIGVLISIANTAAMVGTVLIGTLHRSRMALTYFVSMLLSGLGIASVGYLAGSVVWAGLALGLSGLGSGVLQTLGPHLAATAVLPHEKGNAIATYGTIRVSAMFLAPLAVSGGILLLPVSMALLIVGGALAVPALAVRTVHRVTADAA